MKALQAVLDRVPRMVLIAARRWSALISLLAFQVVPIPIERSTDGTLTIGFGAGADGYLQQAFDCDGNPTASRNVHAKRVSGLVEYRPTKQVRISAFGGNVTSTVGACTSTRSEYFNCPFNDPMSGAFGGALVIYEGRRAAFGLGLVDVPLQQLTTASGSVLIRRGADIVPALHLRIGHRDGVHTALDVNSVRVAGELPMSSLGIGVGVPGDLTEYAFLGIGVLPYKDVGNDGPIAAMGRFAIPVVKSADIVVGGYFGAGEMRGAQIGVRWNTPIGR